MELRNLRTFVRVAEENSFTKAAQQLGYTQAAVTHQIKQLEEELGIQLFERIRNQTKLTMSGEQLMPLVYNVLKGADDINSFANADLEIRGQLKKWHYQTLRSGPPPQEQMGDPADVRIHRPALQISQLHESTLAGVTRCHLTKKDGKNFFLPSF